MLKTNTLGCALSLILASAAVAPAARVILQHGHHGYSGAEDTWLNEASQRDNYGGAPSLTIRYEALDGGYIEDCTLVRFSLPSVTCDSVTDAILELFYVLAGSMWENNAMGIKPYRVHPSKPWFENTRNGESGQGASWRYYGQTETPSNEWTSQSGGWYDKIDDGNGSNLIKKTGGTVTNAIEPGNWVPFAVTRSVLQWMGGATNNGFILFTCSFQGTGNEAYGVFAARETNNAAVRPRLRIQYSGAHVVWGGFYGNVWDTMSTNWSVGGMPGCYDEGDHVWLTDATLQTNILLTAARTPGSVTVSNSSSVLTLSGSPLMGGMIFTKLGTGICVLASSNNYFGNTLIRAGVVSVRTNHSLGNISAGTVIESNGVLRLENGCHYEALENLQLAGKLAALNGENTWAGPVQFAAGAQLEADNAILNLAGALEGTGDVSYSGSGMLRFIGSGASSWTGSLTVRSGLVSFDRSTGPVLLGDITVGSGAAATLSVARAGQFVESCRLDVLTNSLLTFTAADATCTLTRLYLYSGSVDSGPAVITLANTVTATSPVSPSRLKGLFTLASTDVVFRAASGATAGLIVEGSLIGGGVAKADFGNMVLAGANAPTATWRVLQGTLTVAHSQGLGGEPVWVNGHSTLQLSTNAVWTNRLLGLGALYAIPPATNAIWAGEISLGAGTYIIGARTGACLVLDTDLNAPSARLSIRGGGEVKFPRTSNHGNGTLVTSTTVWVCNTYGSALGFGTVELWAGSALKGTGLLAAPVSALAGSVIQPGHNAGILTISNSVTFDANSTFTITSGADGWGRLELLSGGMVSIHSNALFTVNGFIPGTNPVVILRGARDLKGTFHGLPSGAALPWPNNDWHIHYQPNAIYLGRNARAVWYFRAVVNERETFLSWRTPIEIGVSSFDLYREEGGVWQKINFEPIPATHPDGGTYWFQDPEAPPGTTPRYQLVQLLENGQSNILITCERKISAIEFTNVRGPDPERTVLQWRSREDETYRLEQMNVLDGSVETITPPIPATPDENAYTISLSSTQGFYRVVWEP